jgi:NADH-quinone oxidoreductase subunit A
MDMLRLPGLKVVVRRGGGIGGEYRPIRAEVHHSRNWLGLVEFVPPRRYFTPDCETFHERGPGVLQPYIPILLLLLFVVANAALIIGASTLLSSSRPTAVKLAAYESGMPVLGDARERFSVKFYLVAMLFIVFDIETIYMIPWAVAFHQMRELAGVLLLEMLTFVGILAVGYVYIWKRGAFQWD